MLHDKEDRARLIRQASKQAIALAMEGRWKEAVESNKGILESFPDDVDTLNRLGRAHMELREYNEARVAYQRARDLDPYNSIADKNLKRLSNLDGDSEAKEDAGRLVEPRYFIEEIGKAGVVKLFNLAPKEILARVVAGDRVNLEINDGNLTARSEDGQLLGWVEPRHGQRLARLMSAGNQYLATVTSSSEDDIAIIIRETYQHPSQANQLSFPTKGVDVVRPFVSDKVIRHHLEYEDGGVEEPYGLTGDEEGEQGPEETPEETEEEEE
jgi:tetratricopeptide (TPR) repeat protein